MKSNKQPLGILIIIILCWIISYSKLSGNNLAAHVNFASKGNEFKLTNLTALSEAYVANNQVLIDDFTGIDYNSDDFLPLAHVCIDLKALTGFDVWDIGFNYITLQTNTGLDVSFQATIPLITSSKYILFCFVLKEQSEGGLADILVNIGGDHGFDENEKVFLEKYIQQLSMDFFLKSNDVFHRAEADATGVRGFINYLSPESQLKPTTINMEGSQGQSLGNLPFFWIKEQKTYLSMAGVPITLPANAEVAFFPESHEQTGILYKFRLHGYDNTFIPYSWSESGLFPNEFAGYGYLKSPELPLKVVNMKMYSDEDLGQNYPLNDTAIVTIGKFNSTCHKARNGYTMQDKKFLVQWPDKSLNEPKPYSDYLIPKRAAGVKKEISEIEPYLSTSDWVYSYDEQRLSWVLNFGLDYLHRFYPCHLYEVEPISLNEALYNADKNHTKCFKYENDDIGIFFSYKDRLYCYYINYQGEEEVFVHLINGWVPVSFNPIDFADIVKKVSLAIVIGVPTASVASAEVGVFLLAKWGIEASVAAEVASEVIGGAVIYTATEDVGQAVQGVVFMAGAGLTVKILSNSFKFLRIAIKERLSLKIQIRLEDGTLINLTEFDDFVKNTLKFDDATYTALLDDLYSADNQAFRDYLFGDYERRVRTWEILLSQPSWRTNVEYLTKITRYTDNGLKLVSEGGEIIVRQSNGVRLGKIDINDPYNPGTIKVKAEISQRHFDPDEAGGLIVKKSWANPTISQQGIDDIIVHLNRFGYNADNANMINRLNKIKNGEIPITDYDKRFYTHELEEYSRYRNHGIPDGVNSGVYNGIDAEDFYYNAHTASLESYNVNELTLPLYYP